MSWLDFNVGRVVDALEASGLGPSTVVLFHSDHGFGLGEQGHWGKWTNAENVARVPFLVRVPCHVGALGDSIDGTST